MAKKTTSNLIGLTNPATEKVEAWIGEFAGDWIIIQLEVNAKKFAESSPKLLARAEKFKNKIEKFRTHRVSWVTESTSNR